LGLVIIQWQGILIIVINLYIAQKGTKFLDQLSYSQLLKICCVLCDIGDPVSIRIAKELWLISGRSKGFFFSLKPADWLWGPFSLIFNR